MTDTIMFFNEHNLVEWVAHLMQRIHNVGNGFHIPAYLHNKLTEKLSSGRHLKIEELQVPSH